MDRPISQFCGGAGLRQAEGGCPGKAWQQQLVIKSWYSYGSCKHVSPCPETWCLLTLPPSRLPFFSPAYKYGEAWGRGLVACAVSPAPLQGPKCGEHSFLQWVHACRASLSPQTTLTAPSPPNLWEHCPSWSDSGVAQADMRLSPQKRPIQISGGLSRLSPAALSAEGEFQAQKSSPPAAFTDGFPSVKTLEMSYGGPSSRILTRQKAAGGTCGGGGAGPGSGCAQRMEPGH